MQNYDVTRLQLRTLGWTRHDRTVPGPTRGPFGKPQVHLERWIAPPGLRQAFAQRVTYDQAMLMASRVAGVDRYAISKPGELRTVRSVRPDRAPLKSLRRRFGLQMGDLARALGVSVVEISAWERGIAPSPTAAQLKAYIVACLEAEL